MKKKKLLLLLLILLVILAGKSILASVPLPRKPNPVLKSPRHASVQVNAVMVRGKPLKLPLALPLPNSKLVWVANSSQDLIVNYTVWESQDLRTWRVIGTVTAPVGTATATEFDLGFSVFQTTKPYAFWRVSVAWKV